MNSETATFSRLCERYKNDEKQRTSIGLLKEKTLHAVLKDFVLNDELYQEVKLGRFVADVFDGKGVTEIQTKALKNLCKKLSAFLQDYSVTVIYPICQTKYLYWIDAETGLVSQGRKSSKTGKPSHALAEIDGIKQFLDYPNFNLRLFFVDAEEYRIKDGFGKDNKKRATKKDIFPIKLNYVIDISSAADLKQLLPAGLEQPFNTTTLNRALGLTARNAFYAKRLLLDTGLIIETGKMGKATAYKLNV